MRRAAIPRRTSIQSAAVLLCLKGKGYTYTWPAELGMTPWKDGKGDHVKQQNYEYGGLVSAAPMSGDWFHQHFGISKDPLRVSAWHRPEQSSGRASPACRAKPSWITARSI